MLKKIKLKRKFKVFFLLYFMFFSSFFITTTFSKYLGLVEGSGTVGVAKWEVNIDTTGSNSNLNVVSGNGGQNYTLSVTSTSEVAVNYSIIVKNVPSGMKISIDGGTSKTGTGADVTFTNVGSFDANDNNSTHTHSIIFDVPLDVTVPDSNQIDIDVVFIQKQI